MKFCVIGLGRFGYQVATTLSDNGMEVVAVDSNESIVSAIRDYVTQAICLRISDEASLRNIGVEEMDTVIVAMGENFAQSILITAILKKEFKQLKVITRAVNDIHKDILKLVGADRVVLPEKEIAIKVADNLSSPFMDLIRLTKNFSVSQIIAPDQFVGKKVQELDLFKNYKVRCIGLTEPDKDRIVPADPSYIIQQNDRLVFAGNTKDLEKIAKLS
ncbi:MAG TPA: TrkA family potassium uptake protein [Candidatus Bathyarchaeia archaeon]|nr:TrkA family potassium uptake protein [Candidatus Bathyarchaeia archaeon]